jgi:hypothetical protein
MPPNREMVAPRRQIVVQGLPVGDREQVQLDIEIARQGIRKRDVIADQVIGGIEVAERDHAGRVADAQLAGVPDPLHGSLTRLLTPNGK